MRFKTLVSSLTVILAFSHAQESVFNVDPVAEIVEAESAAIAAEAEPVADRLESVSEIANVDPAEEDSQTSINEAKSSSRDLQALYGVRKICICSFIERNTNNVSFADTRGLYGNEPLLPQLRVLLFRSYVSRLLHWTLQQMVLRFITSGWKG